MPCLNVKSQLGSGMYCLGAHSALFKQQLILIDGKLCYWFKTESVTSLELKLGLAREDRCQQKKYLHAIYRQWFMRQYNNESLVSIPNQKILYRLECWGFCLTITMSPFWISSSALNGICSSKRTSFHLKWDQNHQLRRRQTLPIFSLVCSLFQNLWSPEKCLRQGALAL